MKSPGDKEFEKRLRRARPIKPTAELSKRIREDISRIDRSRWMAHWRTLLGWSGMAAAAAFLVISGLMLFNGRLNLGPEPLPGDIQRELPVPAEEGPAEPAGQFKPVLAENSLKGRTDEGIVFLKNGLTARRYRYEFVDRVIWKNPADGALLEMEIPRDEVVLVPVQTF